MKLVKIYEPKTAIKKRLNEETGAVESYVVIEDPKHKYIGTRKIIDRIYDRLIDADPEVVSLAGMYIEEVTDQEEIEQFSQDKAATLKADVKTVKADEKKEVKRGRKPKTEDGTID